MRTGAAFPSKNLKQEDIGDKHVRVVMARVVVETVGQGDDQEQKPVLYFKGHDKGLVLNRTNADTITDIVGTDEMDDWGGKAIVLYVDRNVMMGGKRVGGIRITAPPNGKPAPAPPPVVEDFTNADADGDAHEEVQF
jgi:hypothetical protein